MKLGISTALERHRLANGLQVVLHPDPTLPLATVNLWYHVGSKNERPGRTGFAHLFEHMLFSGSEHVGNTQHFFYLQQVGGVANGSTWYDRTNYYETVPSSRLDLALWLESDRMGYFLPALTAEKLETQRSVVMNERRQRVDNQPYGRPYEHLFELLLPAEHPYHWPVIGWMDDIAAATLEEVREFFRAWYGPNNAVVTVAGDFVPADALARVERWFGEIPSGPEPRPRKAPLAPLDHGIVESVRDRVQLPRVYLAFRMPPFGDRGWFAGSLATSALSDGRSSPLFHDLVYRRQIAQDVSCYVYPTEEVGFLIAVATAKPGVAAADLANALWEHLERLAESGPTAADFERAHNSVLSSSYSHLQALDQRADLISQCTTFFDSPERAFEIPDEYGSVTPGEIRDFAARHLGRDRGVELTVLPEPEAAA